MRLKKKPVKPAWNERVYEIEADGLSIATIMTTLREQLESTGYTEDEIKTHLIPENVVMHYWYRDYMPVRAKLVIPASELYYNDSLEVYNEELAEYNAWVKENKEAIEIEKKKREEKKLKEKEKKKAHLQKEMERLQKRMEKLS